MDNLEASDEISGAESGVNKDVIGDTSDEGHEEGSKGADGIQDADATNHHEDDTGAEGGQTKASESESTTDHTKQEKSSDFKKDPLEELLKQEKGLCVLSDETIEKLATGLRESILPHFEVSKQSLYELIRNQELLLDTVQQENRKYSENQMIEEINSTMMKVKQYQQKLINIKKDMVHIHDRSIKLKKRALKLQNQKMAENLRKEQQRERELEEDKKLMARPAAS